MITTVLFDLDDTLLGNDMDTFIPHYFALLEKFTKQHFDIQDFLPSMMKAVELMVRNTDPKKTNFEVFWQEMEQLTGINGMEAEPIFNEFYRGEFDRMQAYTTTIPSAVDLIRTCIDEEYKVVIATNPMFPRTAVDARLQWAGIPESDFDYTLVTTIENMHATKPHQEYYRELLDKIGSSPEESIMVGDDWQRDIEPTARMGLFTYWIQLPGTEPLDTVVPTDFGTLPDLLSHVQTGWFRCLSKPI